jgi:hypothetical protein
MTKNYGHEGKKRNKEHEQEKNRQTEETNENIDQTMKRKAGNR